MRIRKIFAAGFVGVSLVAGALTLAPAAANLPQYKQSDKVAHFVMSFLITVCFYWILETSRRRMIHLTLLVCTVGLGIGSEILQGLLPNGRLFDPFDIVANLLGSGMALTMCAWYHKRMLERKRAARYHMVPGDEDDGVELRDEEQEVGVVDAEPTVTEQLDTWDENAEDWDDNENDNDNDTRTTPNTTKPIAKGDSEPAKPDQGQEQEPEHAATTSK